MRFKYPQGSMWRRWDLHVHSPDSILENNFEGSSHEEKWENYLAALESLEEISVIGVTDYYSVSGYKKLREFKSEGRLSNIDLLLPNVELRLLLRTENNGTVNLHVIFNPDIVNDLEHRFFSELKFKYLDSNYKCIKSDLIRLGRDHKGQPDLDENAALKEGANQFKVSLENLRAVFDQDQRLKANAFLVVPNSSTDGNSGIQDGSFAAIRREIYRFSDAIFSGNPRDRKYFLGEGADSKEDIIRNYGNLLPCIHGSDAHSNDKIGHPDQDRYCWIKADPTFEGLKQILLEPETRVLIQKESPLQSSKRSYLSKIFSSSGKIFEDAQVSTSEIDLKLNPYMVSIIGGRGTGKSLLLDLIKQTFFQESGRSSDVVHNDFRVSLKKLDGTVNEYELGNKNFVDYLHVSQGDVKEVVGSSVKLDIEIKKMIGMPTDGVEISSENNEEIERIIEILDLFSQRDEDGNLKHSRDKYIDSIDKYKELIKTITTEENQELIDKYRKNQANIGTTEKSIVLIDEAGKKLRSFKDDMNLSFDVLNELTEELSISPVRFDTQEKELLSLKEILVKRIEENRVKNAEIKESLKEKGVDGDIAYLLEKVKEYQVNINHYEKELEKITQKEDEYKAQFKTLAHNSEEVKLKINGYISEIDSKWKELKDGKEGWSEDQVKLNRELIDNVEVKGELNFIEDVFYEKLLEGLNKGKFRASKNEKLYSKAKEVFNVGSFEDYIKLITNEKVINYGDGEPINLESFLKNGAFVKNGEYDFLKTLFSRDVRDKYLRVMSKITYMGKKPEQLSVGQRGTFYLCLKLATNTFGSTLIYDQPEDDLDNNFIVKELVPLLRKIKKYRQVILVTHNANVVVNADSEQIIVASNVGERLFYASGSIENTFIDAQTEDSLRKQGIKEHVCDTLEGGLNAFKAREKKYDL